MPQCPSKIDKFSCLRKLQLVFINRTCLSFEKDIKVSTLAISSWPQMLEKRKKDLGVERQKYTLNIN